MSALLKSPELSARMVKLLETGAAHDFGYCARGPQAHIGELQNDLIALERFGYVRRGYSETRITEAGRAAIGAPSEDEARLLRLRRYGATITPKMKEVAAAVRTEDHDYKNYHAMNMCCIIAVKLPDTRYQPASVMVAKAGTLEPRYLGAKNSIILPESEGRIVLAVIPRWLQERTLLPTWADELPDGGDWTPKERAKFKALATRCRVINRKIQDANKIKFNAPMGFHA